MELLAGHFALDILAFAVMSNHVHVILRNRPDLVASWPNEEVVRRWWQLFPQRRDDNGQPTELTDVELRMLCAKEGFVAERRRRLSSISWFMRCLCEPIARRANREDDVTGRFWQGRFRCQPLLDESAVLACAVYVDLNPTKAKTNETPVTARFTSIYERIMASNRGSDPSSPDSDSIDATYISASTRSKHATWLSPVELVDQETSNRPMSDRRASDRGFLPMSEERYINLVKWTALQLKGKPCPSTLHEVAINLLARIKLEGRTFVRWVESFGRITRRAAGSDPSMAREAARCGRRWLQRSHESRKLLG